MGVSLFQNTDYCSYLEKRLGDSLNFEPSHLTAAGFSQTFLKYFSILLAIFIYTVQGVITLITANVKFY